jgi:hypothetical protein
LERNFDLKFGAGGVYWRRNVDVDIGRAALEAK